MVNYHINKDGDPGKCAAKHGNCPYAAVGTEESALAPLLAYRGLTVEAYEQRVNEVAGFTKKRWKLEDHQSARVKQAKRLVDNFLTHSKSLKEAHAMAEHLAKSGESKPLRKSVAPSALSELMGEMSAAPTMRRGESLADLTGALSASRANLRSFVESRRAKSAAKPLAASGRSDFVGTTSDQVSYKPLATGLTPIHTAVFAG